MFNNNNNSTTEILMGNNDKNDNINTNHTTTPYYCTPTDDEIAMAHSNIQYSMRTKKAWDDIQYMIYLVLGVMIFNILFFLYSDTNSVNVGITCGIMIILVGIAATAIWIMNVHCVTSNVNNTLHHDNTPDTNDVTTISSSPHEIRKMAAWTKLTFMFYIFGVTIVFQLIFVLLEKHDIALAITILVIATIIYGIVAAVMWFIDVYFVSIHHFLLGEEGTTVNDSNNNSNPLYIRKKQTCGTIQSMYTLFQITIGYNFLVALYQSIYYDKDISNFFTAYIIFGVLYIIIATAFWIISVHCLRLDHTLIDTNNNTNDTVDESTSSPLVIRKRTVWIIIKYMIYFVVGTVIFNIILALLDGKDIATIGTTCGVITIVFGIIAAVIWIFAVYCIPISSSTSSGSVNLNVIAL